MGVYYIVYIGQIAYQITYLYLVGVFLVIYLDTSQHLVCYSKLSEYQYWIKPIL